MKIYPNRNERNSNHYASHLKLKSAIALFDSSGNETFMLVAFFKQYDTVGLCIGLPYYTCISCGENIRLSLKIQTIIMTWRVVAKRSSASDSSSGGIGMWVRIPAWLVSALVYLNKTLNHNCFILRMGR